jgi:NAD(P)-dependent dehydrogenase (short-subunit alcohol dehydrogenase family)
MRSDVMKPDEIASLFSEVVARHGGVDAVINMPGSMAPFPGSDAYTASKAALELFLAVEASV